MQGRLDASFATAQRDMFESGLVAEIGVNAYAVWMAIKHHADYETGRAWPGLRRLAGLTGLARDTVGRSVHVLEAARLLRMSPRGKGRAVTYVARERMDVRVGELVLCTVVIDYVPSRLRGQLERLQKALKSGKDAEAFAQVEIIPGEGFSWDADRGCLVGKVSVHELPSESDGRRAQLEQIGRGLLDRVQCPSLTKG